jgi:molybdopterin-guanine dinucleotide biosynthesis protein A
MGRDKATLPVSGETLLSRTAALAAGVAPAVVVGRARPGDWPNRPAEFVSEERPGAGPLGGIEAGLGWAAQRGFAAVAVLPCDLPLLTPEALAWLLDNAAFGPSDDGAAVQGAEGRIEPLFSVYSVRCRERINACLAAGQRSPTDFIRAGRFRMVAAPDFVQSALEHANTPEEWAEIAPRAA